MVGRLRLVIGECIVVRVIPLVVSSLSFLGLLADGGSGVAKKPPSLTSVTLIPQWWNVAVIPYLKKFQKHINRVTHHLRYADITFFQRKSATFVTSRNTDIDYIFIHNFWLIFFESLKVVLLNMVAILMMSTKLATVGLLK